MADEPDGPNGPNEAFAADPEAADPTVGGPIVEPVAENGSNRRWSPPSLAVLFLAVVAVGFAAVYHLGTVFLSIAPRNPVSQQHAAAINEHVMPEFEQNWQLFAPNPLQQNIAIQTRVETVDAEGHRVDSPWIDLTAQDVAAIKGNLVPSHVNQNLLRRAWDYYTAWHDQDEKSTGFGGPLSVEYLKRIGLQRIGRTWQGQKIIQIEFRSATTDVTGPSWTGAPATASPVYRTLPWWPATDDDYAGLGTL